MRTLTSKEYEFLKRIERLSGGDLHEVGLSLAGLVEPMADGGMGSLRFQSQGEDGVARHFGKVFAQGEFDDQDGVPISFAINLDTDGKLFELDLWRVDFEPLQRLPEENDKIRMLTEEIE